MKLVFAELPVRAKIIAEDRSRGDRVLATRAWVSLA